MARPVSLRAGEVAVREGFQGQTMTTPWHSRQEDELVALIRARTGIIIHSHQRPALHATALAACHRFGYADNRRYLAALAQLPAEAPEFEHLFTAITVGESYFFRDTPQMTLLREHLLPRLIQRKRAAGDLTLRLWSAGCSSGQEPYSLAILLDELLPDLRHWTLHLLATDINPGALAEARLGRYRDWSLRGTLPTLRQRYFLQHGEVYELDPALRQRVCFSCLNLSADAYPSTLTETQALDLILCRNVLIYLAPETIAQVLQQFTACLLPEGVLMLGASDLVPWPRDRLELVQADNASYFRRLPPARSTAPVAPAAQPPASPSQPTAPSRPVPRRPTARPAVPIGAVLEQVRPLLAQGRWREAMRQLQPALDGGANDARLWRCKAEILANLGELRAAEAACQTALKLDPLDKQSHLILGLTRLELNRLDAAAAALRKALFLDHDFAEAHYELALVLLRQGDQGAGVKSLQRALACAEDGAPERHVCGTPSLNYARFADMLRNELVVYGSPPH